MKILCVIKTSHGAQWLVEQVHAMVARGHQVTVLMPTDVGPLSTALRAEGARVHPVRAGISPSRLLMLPADVVRMRRIIRSESPHVLFYQLWASATLARLASVGIRGLVRIHMVPGPLFLEMPLVRAAEHALVRLDDLVIAGSRHTAVQYRRLHVPPRRIITIPYGADLEFFKPVTSSEQERFRRKLDIPRDAFVAVMVALVYGGKPFVHRRRPIKGHEDLLRAWRQFCPEGRPKRLLLVGGGFDKGGRAHRAHLMEAFGDDSTITWVPTVRDVRPFYGAANVSVSPSLSDNHGAAVEAGAMGVPSVVSDAGALKEVVNGSGWVFPAGDYRTLAARLAVVASLSPMELAARGAAARQRVEQCFDAREARSELIRVMEDRVRADDRGD